MNIDFHTHHPGREDEFVLQDGVQTWGIHPWHLDVLPICNIDEALAIGECGLDRLCDTPYDQQIKAFRRCIEESEKRHLPLILHCVRAIEDCLALRRELHCQQPWIWHGYRGKATQLRQLLPHGFYFSFGFQHNQEALQSCPLDRLMLETDEDLRPISTLYTQVAGELNISEEELSKTLYHTYQRLFTLNK